MVTVTTKEGLERALKNNENEIEITGELAEKIKKQRRRKKLIGYGVAGACFAVGVVAAPFTGGASAYCGLTAGTAAGGFVAMSTTELVIMCLTVLGFSGSVILLLKQYEYVEMEGSVSKKNIKGGGRLVLKKKQSKD